MPSRPPASAFDLLRCPADGSTLHRTNIAKEDTAAACGKCGRRYPIVNAIVDLLPDANGLHPSSIDEMRARDADAPTYDARFSAQRNAMELPAVFAAVGDLEGKVVLELGAGTGRATVHIARRAAATIAVDLSRRSLEVLDAKFRSPGLVLVAADASALVLAEEAFDVVVSTQVLEHILPRERRISFIELVRRHLRPGGIAVFTAYHHDGLRRLRGLPPDGVHPSGVPFHCFGVDELRADVATYFPTNSVRRLQAVPPGAARVGLPLPALSRVFERVPLINEISHLLLVRAVKDATRSPVDSLR